MLWRSDMKFIFGVHLVMLVLWLLITLLFALEV